MPSQSQVRARSAGVLQSLAPHAVKLQTHLASCWTFIMIDLYQMASLAGHRLRARGGEQGRSHGPLLPQRVGGGGGEREADVVVGVYARPPQRKKTLETSETPCTCFVAFVLCLVFQFFLQKYLLLTHTTCHTHSDGPGTTLHISTEHLKTVYTFTFANVSV